MARKSPMEGGTAPERKAKEEPEADPKLIETDDPEDKILIKMARKVRAAGAVEGEARDKSTAARQNLIDEMKKQERTHYRFGKLEIDLKINEKISVKESDHDAESDD